MNFKTGFIAVIGRPNVGKSSLINAMVGEKVSITGPKPQTTRNKILGIKNEREYQMIFVDTPGLVKPSTKLDEYMDTVISKSSQGIDALLIVIDATRMNEADENLIKKYENSKFPVFVAVNKLDLVNYEQIFPILAKLNKFTFVNSFYSVSAKKGKNVPELVNAMAKVLPEGEELFPSDIYTDKNLKFIAGETVREKALLFLQDEIPHGIAVEITKFEECNNLYRIFAEIICDKQNHKQIIIGKNAEMLSKIGKSARINLESMFQKKIWLELFVKVKENWKNSDMDLKNLGYDKKNL